MKGHLALIGINLKLAMREKVVRGRTTASSCATSQGVAGRRDDDERGWAAQAS